MDLQKYYKEKFARNHYRNYKEIDTLDNCLISFQSEFEGITAKNVFMKRKQKLLISEFCRKTGIGLFLEMTKIREFNDYFNYIKDLTENNFFQTENKLTSKENREKSENNFFQTENKLTSKENREKSEFNLFTEIILKVCEKNKSWLSNCLFTSNENCKRHDIS